MPTEVETAEVTTIDVEDIDASASDLFEDDDLLIEEVPAYALALIQGPGCGD